MVVGQSAGFVCYGSGIPTIGRKGGNLMASLRALCATLILAVLCTGTTAARAQACEVDHKVVFAGLDYDSNAFHTALARHIIEHGYGCATDQQPGALVPLHNAMARGDVHLIMEVWKSNEPESWTAGVAAGQLVEVGTNFPDAIQGWFIPRYLVEGSAARAPDLRSVSDLPRYKDVFRDPEEPAKGRFLNCIAGWQCEVVNTKKLHAYGLTEHYTNFRPGTGAALAAAVESAIKRRRPVLFYYWGPTWLLGKLGDDLIMLEEPPFDAAKWAALNALEDPSHATDATAYPVVEVVIGANAGFISRAPQLHAFLTRYETTGQQVSEALAYMQDNDATPEAAALDFLRRRTDIWSGWLPPEVAERVRQSL